MAGLREVHDKIQLGELLDVWLSGARLEYHADELELVWKLVEPLEPSERFRVAERVVLERSTGALPRIPAWREISREYVRAHDRHRQSTCSLRCVDGFESVDLEVVHAATSLVVRELSTTMPCRNGCPQLLRSGKPAEVQIAMLDAMESWSNRFAGAIVRYRDETLRFEATTTDKIRAFDARASEPETRDRPNLIALIHRAIERQYAKQPEVLARVKARCGEVLLTNAAKLARQDSIREKLGIRPWRGREKRRGQGAHDGGLAALRHAAKLTGRALGRAGEPGTRDLHDTRPSPPPADKSSPRGSQSPSRASGGSVKTALLREKDEKRGSSGGSVAPGEEPFV